MKRINFYLALTALCFLISGPLPGWALTVWCKNCSNHWTQAIEKATSADQLKTALKDYQESLEQTRQQIALVQNNIQQYENMLQNTKNLPKNLLSQLKGDFTNLARLTNELNVQRGDVFATTQIFNELYPAINLLENIAEFDGDLGALWNKWSAENDRAAQATFKLTASQLNDISQNSEKLDGYIESLLSTPEGQMEAIQSGNSLATIQINELRQLRTLMATNIQATTQEAMKTEKKEQIGAEKWREAFKPDQLKDEYKNYE